MDYVDVDSTEFFAGPHDPKAKLLPNIVDFCWLHAFEDTDFKKICHYFYTQKFQGAGRLRRLVIELPERVEEYSEAAEAKSLRRLGVGTCVRVGWSLGGNM
jgi:hypothetical protein